MTSTQNLESFNFACSVASAIFMLLSVIDLKT